MTDGLTVGMTDGARDDPGGDLLRVVDAGALTLLEDLGRAAGSSIGLPRGGTVDRGALRLANRLVGNPEGAAGLEVLWGGLSFEVLADTVVAICGASCPVTVNGRPRSSHVALPVGVGDVVRLGRPVLGVRGVGIRGVGVRAVVALAGGLAGDEVLGSVSSSPTAGLGRAPLRAGEVMRSAGLPNRAGVATDLAVSTIGRGVRPQRVVPGPRDDWVTAAARDGFVRTGWRVSPQCDRVGVRLEGAALEWLSPGSEFPSEAVIPGSVQVPPDGRPLVFLADHPTTGGYPVIGVVHPDDLDALGQVGPGDEVWFEWFR